jgi:hypothetical protein
VAVPWIVAGQDRLTRDNWGRLDTQLAISMRNRDAFDDVRMTFDAMAEMLEPGTTFNEQWMRKVHDRVAWPALEALSSLTLPMKTRIRRRVNELRRRLGWQADALDRVRQLRSSPQSD